MPRNNQPVERDIQRHRTDERGRVRFRGYLGDYQLSVDGMTATFSADEIGTTTPIRCALT
jgi:hypothetical protein